MKQNNNFGNLEAVIEFAGSILKLTSGEMRKAFPQHSIKSFEYITKGKTEEIAEISFEDNGTTLSCKFARKGYCKVVYIYPDYYGKPEEYEGFFNKTYKYMQLRKRWKTGRYYLYLIYQENAVYFKIQ